MKKNRFTEEQIVAILKENDAGVTVKTFAGKTESLMARSTPGALNMVACR